MVERSNEKILQYYPEFSDLNISRKNIFKYLGYTEGKAPDPYPEILEDLLITAKKIAEIKAGFVVFDNINIAENSALLSVNGTDFNTGKIISSALQDSQSVCFFVCTAGKGIEEFSRKLMKEDKAIEGYIMDMIGSEVVETAMDFCQDKFESSISREILRITNRYSPGYCGWNVSEQHKLFGLLPPEFCNIKLKESALMIPIKSVSGIIGIGKDVVKKEYACVFCEQENCVYRKGKF